MKRGGRDLAEDMRWTLAELAASRKVWIVRSREPGLVVAFITTADRPERLAFVYGVPVSDLTVASLTVEPGHSAVSFGEERPWSAEEFR